MDEIDARRAHDLARQAEENLEWSEAVRQWREYVKFGKREWWSYTALAVALREVGHVDEAYEELRRAQDFQPHHPHVLADFSARCDWADALRGCLTGKGADRELSSRAIQAVIRAGFQDVAQAWLKKALALFPDDEHIAYLYSHSAARFGDLNEAARRARDMLAKFPDHPGLLKLAQPQGQDDELKLNGSLVTNGHIDLVSLGLRRRKNVVFVGNCQAESLAELYRKFIAPQHNDIVTYLKREKFDENIPSHYIENADVLVGNLGCVDKLARPQPD